MAVSVQDQEGEQRVEKEDGRDKKISKFKLTKPNPWVMLPMYVACIPETHRVEGINRDFGLRQKTSSSERSLFKFCRHHFCRRKTFCSDRLCRSDDFGDLKVVTPFRVVCHVNETFQVPMHSLDKEEVMFKSVASGRHGKYSRRPKSNCSDFGAFPSCPIPKHVRFSKTECFRSVIGRSVH